MIRAILALLAVLLAAPAPAQQELEEAAAAIESEDWTRAAALLEKALQNDPEDFRARFNLAFAYTQLGQDDRAIEHYSEVVGQQPDLAGARANLTILLLRNERLAEAVPHLKVLSEERPGEFDVHYNLGRALAATGQAQEAAAAFQKALEINSASAEAHVSLGRALVSLERFNEAAEHYRQAAEIDPGFASLTLELAEKLERRGRIPQALELYQEHAKAEPGNAALLERIGFLYLERDEYEQAVPWLEKAIKVSPSAANLSALAEAYRRTEQPERALSTLVRAADADPSNAGLRMRYATALLERERFEEAARNYHLAAQADSSRLEAWNGLALSLYKLENYGGTLKALEEAARRGPMKPASLYLRAIVEDRLQMHEQALASYQEFLAANSGLEDEEWKSRQRIKALKKVLERR